jgi:hypothetical protein
MLDLIKRRFIYVFAFFMTAVLIAQQVPVSANDMVKLEIKLPKPRFIGTPKDLRTPNLEPPRGDAARPDFFVPAGTKNVALDKPVTSSDMEPVIGELEQVTDGDKEGVEGSYVELGPGTQWVQIDLEREHEIYAIVVWNFHNEARVYRDVIVQVANDPDFTTGVQTVFNNDHDNSSGHGIGKDYEYIETFEGRLMDAKGVRGRYVRLYSRGNTSNEMNHRTEVEVFGKPV